MKKSTVLLIFVIYVASTIVIGMFGISIKSYYKINYVKSIEISVMAEDEEMYNFSRSGTDATTGNPKYDLTLNFSTKSSLNEENVEFLALNLIPKITYLSGELADANDEKITFSISNPSYIERGYASLDEKGTLFVYHKGAFIIYVDPVSKSVSGSGAIVNVVII